MKLSTLTLALATVAPTASATDSANSAVEGWNFLVMGDWGGQPVIPYTTKEEVITSKGMGAVSATLNSSYCLALGDNFYYSGVKSTDDHRWKATFEDVFTAPTLQGDDYFRVLLGNHDHLGSTDAQVQYSNISARWRMDDLYWSFSETAADGSTLDTIFIDTVTWAGSDHVVDEFGGVHSVHGDQLPGPADQAAADAQLEWLEDKLKASTADFIIVAGHYPVYSICEHGSTTALQNLIPLLEQYQVAAYLNGHDHCQQYIDEGKGVQYHTIGSAHTNSGDDSHRSSVPEGSLKWHVGLEDGPTGGFGLVTIADGTLTVQHFDGNGTVVYTAPSVPARTNKTTAEADALDPTKSAPRLFDHGGLVVPPE